MSTRVCDKENECNTNSSRYSVGGKGLLNSVNTPKQKGLSTLLTPKLNQLNMNSHNLSSSIQKDANKTATKREKRPFGVELQNRTQVNQQQVGKTPSKHQVNKCLNWSSSAITTPSVKMNKLGEQQQKSVYCEEKETVTGDENLGPVEHFIGNKYDNFDDLYDSRINEYLAQMIVNTRRSQSPIKNIYVDVEESNDYKKRLQKTVRQHKRMEKKLCCSSSSSSIALPLFEQPIFEDLFLPQILEDSF